MRNPPPCYMSGKANAYPARVVSPGHGHTLVFWTDASVGEKEKWPKAGIAVVAEEFGEYVMHDADVVSHMSSSAAEWQAILRAQELISTLSDEEQARACIVTDSQMALCAWWTHDSYRGGAPLFYQPPERRPRAYELAHELANWTRQGRRGPGPTISKFFPALLRRSS